MVTVQQVVGQLPPPSTPQRTFAVAEGLTWTNPTSQGTRFEDRSEPLNDLRAPPLLGLARQNLMTDLPVELKKLGVDGAHGPLLNRLSISIFGMRELSCR